MYECPNCGGAFRFDIPSQQLVCDYCGTMTDPYVDARKRNAESSDTFGTMVYTCPQCGGEVYTNDSTAAGFCSFCGASTMLESRMQGIRKPGAIVPFSKTKEACKAAVSKRMKGAFFASKELRDPEFLDRFRGIYMPYWFFNASAKSPATMKGKKSYRRGDYIITDHFDLNANLEAGYKNIYFDASESFDDELSRDVAPFDTRAIKPFTPGYLCGFYADAADVMPDAYKGDALDLAAEDIENAFRMEPAFKICTVEGMETDTLVRNVGLRLSKAVSAMMPVWFLSYQKNGRVAYAVVNGQTGRLAMDLPISLQRFAIATAIFTVIFFFLLNFLPVITPRNLLILCFVISLISSIVYLVQSSALRDREQIKVKKSPAQDGNLDWNTGNAQQNANTQGQQFQQGYQAQQFQQNQQNYQGQQVQQNQQFQQNYQGQQGSRIVRQGSANGNVNGGRLNNANGVNSNSTARVAKGDKKEEGKKSGGCLRSFLYVGGTILLILILAFFTTLFKSSGISTVAVAVLATILAISIIMFFAACKSPTDKLHFLPMLVVMLFGFILYIRNPVEDFIYYGAALLFYAAICLFLFRVVIKYNDLATRPLPQMSIKGGDTSAPK